MWIASAPHCSSTLVDAQPVARMGIASPRQIFHPED